MKEETRIIFGDTYEGGAGSMYDIWETECIDGDIYLKGKHIGTFESEVIDKYISFEDGSKYCVEFNSNTTYVHGEDGYRGPIATIEFNEGTKITHDDLIHFENESCLARHVETVTLVYKELFEQAIEKGVEFKISIDDICPTNFLETLVRAEVYEEFIFEVMPGLIGPTIEKAFTKSKIYRLEESPTGLTIIADNRY